jgi:hypothetical protein
MYKDKEKQKEMAKERARRYRALRKGVTKGVTIEGVTGIPEQGVTVTPTVTTKPKFGKDIKCFADLPPDVQHDIIACARDEDDKAQRTAIVINYQHLFPHRYYAGNAIPSLARDVSDYPGVIVGYDRQE